MDFKDSIFLPETDFQMRANLAQKEPEILKYWENLELYQIIRKNSAGKNKFVLHDGPPFANGTPHAGTAMNKILKDIIIKMKQMQGFDAALIPGWDCHGLPIEWKVEEQIKAKGQKREDFSIPQFRNMCEKFAEYWIGVQKEGFKRLGVIADFNHPYLTMDRSSEASIIRQLGKLIVDGTIYRGEKPVFWSVVEQTALADAEIEYIDKQSLSIYVAFPICSSLKSELSDAFCVIWTTTPWTIPGNRAICYSKDITYCLLLSSVGKKLIVAKDLVQDFLSTTSISADIILEFSGKDLDGTTCHHPLRQSIDNVMHYDFLVPLIDGDHVETESGTGLVHTAPGHGIDDFNVCKKCAIPVPMTVNAKGIYHDCVSLFAGKHIFKVEQEIINELEKCQSLVFSTKIMHSYPHSWRSKAPLIYRTTPQWFFSLDKTGIRKLAMEEIEKTVWIPSHGQNRIKSFVNNRGDWCLSRQRTWGIPLPIFMHKKDQQPLQDIDVINRVADVFEREGSNSWFEKDPQEFLGDKYSANDFEQLLDTADVWFESSSSHAYVLKERPELSAQADMYLEGSDQHRGWFQHSLLVSCGVNQKAPFKSVMTHGFIVDEQGRKMSKSLGNTITLQEIVDKLGADVFRMWVASSDFTQDLKLGMNILKQLEDVYRKLRNTIRYILGALHKYDFVKEHIEYEDLDDFEKLALHRIAENNQILMQSIDAYDINKYFSTLYNFYSVEMSALYFDIRKDCLYCDREDNPKRMGYRFVLKILIEYMLRWIAPIMSYTAEEAWTIFHQKFSNSAADKCAIDRSSVHLSEFLTPESKWIDNELAEKYEKIREFRKVVTTALEVARKNKLIGSSLQACVTVYDPKNSVIQNDDLELWKEMTITSDFVFNATPIPEGAFISEEMKDVGVVISLAEGEKCERCWKISKDIKNTDENKICKRCKDFLAK